MTIPLHGDHHGRTFVGIPGPRSGTAWALPLPTDPEHTVVTGCVLVWEAGGKPVDEPRHLRAARRFLATYGSQEAQEFLVRDGCGLYESNRDNNRLQYGALRARNPVVHAVKVDGRRRTVRRRDETQR